VDTPEERIHWLRRAAVTARAAGRADLAIACCQRILEEQPSEPETELMLQDLYRARGDAAPLARLLRQSLAHADAERERAIHAELAAHLEGPLDDPCGAFMHITRAVELDPSDMELLDRAMALASLVGGELSQLDLLDQAAAAASDSQVRARVLVRRASHLADTLGWNEEALDGWKAVAALDPSCEEAALRLARV